MEAATRALGEGDVQIAFACFQSASRASPTMADAWYMQGGVFVMVGNPQAATPFFEHATALRPDHAEAWFELGNAHLAQGQPRRAEAALAASARAIADAEAAGGGGDRGATAARWGGKAGLELLPTVVSNLGNALLEMDRAAEAVTRYEESVAMRPPLCIAFNGLSNAFEHLGRYEAAQDACARGIRALPSCDLAYYNLGRLLRAAQDRQAEAAAAHRAAMRLVPANAQYVNAYGTALQSEDNARAGRAYRRALALAPSWSAPYRNLGLLEYEEGRSEAALALFARVVQLEPTSVDTYTDMGTAYLERRDLLGSLAEYERALRLQPTNRLAHANLVYLRTKLCEWRARPLVMARLHDLADELLDAANGVGRSPLAPAPHLFLPPYHALAYEGFTPTRLRALAALYAGRAAMTSAAPPTPPPAELGAQLRAAAALAAADRRPVVGYVTPDFGDHPTSHLMRSVWRLQGAAGRVRAVCFARTPSDGSPNRLHIEASCEEFVDLSSVGYREAAAAINARRVQLLVDLNGHCGRPQFELLSLRAAPLQLTYMGHPGTSGAAYVQYVVVDVVTTPPTRRFAAHFSEKLVALPQWHVTDYRDAHAFDALGTPPRGAPTAGRRLKWPPQARRAVVETQPIGGGAAVEGLPAAAFVMATFNQLYKVSAPFWHVWCNALRRAPRGLLWVLEFPRTAADNLAAEAAAAGVRTARLRTARTAERGFHLARAAVADLALDTAPYNGHTTAGDAVWMGTPLLTLPGDGMQTRVGASYATAAGCAQLVVRSLRQYEHVAAALASGRHRARFDALRGCLARHRWTSAAFDTARWVSAFDDAVHMIVDNHRRGLAPKHMLAEARRAGRWLQSLDADAR